MIYKYCKIVLFYTLILTVASSCSLTNKKADNEAVKSAITQVIVQYLQFSFLSRLEPLESTIIKQDFLHNQGITKDEYDYRIVRLSRRWPINENPLIQLKVKDLKLDGDNATAVLQREGTGFPELIFTLIWTGSSWVIIDDNIFGKNELYEKGSS